MSENKIMVILLLAAGLITSCGPAARTSRAPSAPVSTLRSGQLTPYLTPSGTPTATAPDPSTPTPLPSATPTPRSHTVKKGEDLGGIAYQYRLSVGDLMAANPKVNPNAMSVGTVLVIPQSTTPMPPGMATAEASAQPPSPTPIPVEVGKIHCARGRENGVWCFLPVKNTQPFALESLSALVRLGDRQGQNIVPKTGYLPLDVLQPGMDLPIAVYFPAEQVAGLEQPLQASAELLTALPSADNGRYLRTKVANETVLIAENGLSATVSVDVSLDSADSKAQRVWVVIVGYDGAGNVVGMRRWENNNTQPLVSGQVLKVTDTVYSTGGLIERAVVEVEVRP